MERFQKKDDYISPELMKELQQYFQTNVQWVFGWQSEKEKVPFSHWNHDF
ncbi:MAG: hypothetical protein HC858_01595 [Brachymonas sp.]|nr:hypothetical protein [Brachymonas sp.]